MMNKFVSYHVGLGSMLYVNVWLPVTLILRLCILVLDPTTDSVDLNC